jgi:hypothetical protein
MNASRGHLRLAGVASILQSVAYVIAVLSAMWMPLERISFDTEAFAAFFASHPVPFAAFSLSVISLGLLGITAVVPTTAALLDEPHDGWVTAGRNVALLSLGVLIVFHVWFLSTIGGYVEAFNSGDPVLRQIVTVNDPHVPANWLAWFMFGGMGLWVVVVGATVWRTRVLPRGFVLACITKTGGFWIALAGVVLRNIPVAIAGTVIGALIGATWYHTWLGVLMLRRARGAV